VFSIQQIAVCTGDCNGTHTVAINDLITLVNIALGTSQPSACPHGVPSGADVDIAVIRDRLRPSSPETRCIPTTTSEFALEGRLLAMTSFGCR
jgi:hypothetical protein